MRLATHFLLGKSGGTEKGDFKKDLDKEEGKEIRCRAFLDIKIT